MSDRNTAIINFRLNLLKNDDREIYDYIQQFESPEFKAVLKGGKSNFIKTVLLSYIRGTKQEQKAAKTLAEQKAQNEKLAEMLGAKLEESQKALIQALPELVEKVLLETLEGRVVAGTDLKAFSQTVKSAAGTTPEVESDRATAAVKDAMSVIAVAENTGILPQVSEELPDDALDYFSGL